MNSPGSKKTGLFGRLFGGGTSETVSEAINEAAPDDGRSPLSEAGLSEAGLSEAGLSEARKGEAASGPMAGPPPAALELAPEQIVPAPLAPAEASAPKLGWFGRLKSGLAKTSSKLSEGITGIFTKRKLDAGTLQDLEDLLIQADLGVETAMRISDRLSDGRFDKAISAEDVKKVLASEVAAVLGPVARPLQIDPGRKPHVILMVGVNGTGKTTTIGKLAHRFRSEGRKVVLAAGDTFRAAAIDQLKIWGERTGAEVIARDVGADASGLAFDALTRARESGADLLLIDTAGRLQNKTGLMEELAKIVRVLRKVDASAPHDVIITLDATTGQNAMNQVEVFRQIAGVTGIVMTKLDGTARGGILVAIAAKHGLPVHAIGIGEGIDDLQAFEPAQFAEAIAAT